MTREEAKDILQHTLDHMDCEGLLCSIYDKYGCGDCEDALKFAIEALSHDSPEWVLVSKRLPNMEERLKAYVRNHYASEFIVMIRGANRPTTLLLTQDNYWVDENRDEYDVIAWRQLPEPYKESDTE